MGNTYYYFSASLPSINFDGKPPFSLQEFLNECQRLLTEKDFSLIRSLLMEDVPALTGNVLADQWIAFERSFRNEIAYFRAQKAGKDPAEFIRGQRSPEGVMLDAISEAAKAENLFDGERILSQVRWQFLDERQTGHYFDLGFILIYALKIKILERYDRIDSPVGTEIYKELTKINFAEFSSV